MRNRRRTPSRARHGGHTIEGSPEPDGAGRSEVGVEAEQQAEQEFVDMAYARLDAMRDDANAMLEGVLDLGRGGTFQSRTERDVIVRTSLARLEQLDIGDQALTFGRIDRMPEGARVERQTGGAGRTAGQRGGAADGPEAGYHRDLPHRAAGHPQRRPRSTGGGLAGPDRRALLPGHRPGSPGPGAPAPSGPRGPAGGGPRGRAVRRPGSATGCRYSTEEADGFERRGGATGRAHRQRPAHRRPGRPAGRAGPGPLGPDDRHRLDHPA